MSENGEVLYLYSGQDETFDECLVVESFGASETGTSFGRYLKSTGTYNFVPMSEPTPGAANAYPLVGPIVINEIMAEADAMIRSHGFVLPPFAYWSPDTFRARAQDARHIIEARCGWDITDYGEDRFGEVGLVLFTVRNARGTIPWATIRDGSGSGIATRTLSPPRVR